MLVAVAADEPKTRAQLCGLLATQGHRVHELPAFSEAVDGAAAARPQLLVVASADAAAAADLLRRLRERPEMRRLPVLAVDPRANPADGVALLDAGADDAITKPFQPPIFLARVRSLLRRAVWAGDAPEEAVTVLAAGLVELRLLSRQAAVGGKPVELTRLEFDLLAHLLKHPDRAFRREELLAAVWNYPGNVETRTLDKHVESLRRKLGKAAAMVQTVHGHGYRLAPPA